MNFFLVISKINVYINFKKLRFSLANQKVYQTLKITNYSVQNLLMSSRFCTGKSRNLWGLFCFELFVW